MMTKVSISRTNTWWAVTVFITLSLSAPLQAEPGNRMNLRENWFVQSSCKITAPAEVVSSAQFSPDHWYKTTVPSTVLAAQVANGEFKDIYFADNIRKLPGMDYPFGELFSNIDMASGSPYACSWWYRTEFQLPQNFRGRLFSAFQWDQLQSQCLAQWTKACGREGCRGRTQEANRNAGPWHK